MQFASAIDEIIQGLARYSSDPYGFALWAFPWGQPGSPLEHRQLEEWQAKLLQDVRDGLLTPGQAIRMATVSGNGVGKSALVSILILWEMSTFEDTKGIVTANTETQLKTKTWAELGKWFHLFIAKDLFKLSATALCSRDPDHERTWRCDMVPWSEHNVVAFQGLHNEGKRLFMIFDEASGIVDGIWDAGDGCMTDANTQRHWYVFGNPNLPKGRFKECFPGGREAFRWNSRKVDSRDVSFTDKAEFAEWIKLWGEDSDFVRVRVRGVFPRTGNDQFIGPDLAGAAAQREVDVYVYDPLIIGVDVARFGDDESVIFFRKGRDGRSTPPIRRRSIDTMSLAGLVAAAYQEHRADAVFVDGGGVGGGVVDRLRQLNIPVVDVQFGAKSDNNFGAHESGIVYANKRAELWGSTKEWLSVGAIPDDQQLIAELTAPQYGFVDREGRSSILLEAKKDMKGRGLASPDLADALALTFAYPVAPRRLRGEPDPAELIQTEYNPFELEEA
jgi:hypothetical protein